MYICKSIAKWFFLISLREFSSGSSLHKAPLSLSFFLPKRHNHHQEWFPAPPLLFYYSNGIWRHVYWMTFYSIWRQSNLFIWRRTRIWGKRDTDLGRLWRLWTQICGKDTDLRQDTDLGLTYMYQGDYCYFCLVCSFK